MRTWLISTLLPSTLFLVTGHLLAESPEPIKFPVEMGTFRLQVTDPDGQPIPDAKVTASGLRCAEDAGSWYSWPEMNAGSDNVYTTDATGHVEVRYPLKYGIPPNYVTTTILCFDIQHAQYIAERPELATADGMAETQLKAGCDVSFTATDEAGQPLDKFGVMIAGSGYYAMWLRDGATLRSRAVPDGKWQTMLVAPQADGPTLFSGILPARYASGKVFSINNVKLTPGLRVQGKLADDVPRPVRDGIVIAFSQPKPTPKELENGEAVGWSDSAVVEADGTFEFDSLPRGGRLQLIAVCRGYVIENQPREGKQNPPGRTVGVLFDLDSLPPPQDVLSGVTLPMQAAGSLEVTLKKPDGGPLVGAHVSTWPNQILEDSGSNLLGSVYPSMHFIQAQLDPSYQRPDPWRDRAPSRYVVETDAAGKATLYDIPLGRRQELALQHDEFQFASDDGQVAQNPSYQLDTPELRKMEFEVVPIPK